MKKLFAFCLVTFFLIGLITHSNKVQGNNYKNNIVVIDKNPTKDKEKKCCQQSQKECCKSGSTKCDKTKCDASKCNHESKNCQKHSTDAKCSHKNETSTKQGCASVQQKSCCPSKNQKAPVPQK